MYGSARNFGVLFLARPLSTSAVRLQDAESVAAKKDYYKHMADVQNTQNTRPDSWDNAKPFQEIPGPKPLPLLGNTWRFLPVFGDYHNVPLKDVHSKFRKDFGDIVRLQDVAGVEDMVFLYSPKDIENVLRNEGVWPIRDGLRSFKYYRTKIRSDIFKDMGGLTALNGEGWFKLRSAVNPILMQPRTAQMYIEKIDAIALDFVHRIRHLASLGADRQMPEDFSNELNKWSLESIGYIAFEERLGCLDHNLSPDSTTQRLIDAVSEMFDVFFVLETRPAIWKYIPTPSFKRLVKALDYLTFTLQDKIKEARSKIEKEKQHLPEHEKSVLHKFLDKDEKVAVAMGTDMIIAGIDTTSKTLAANLYYLSKHPEAQQKLREEVQKELPNKDSSVTKENLLNMPYLKAVIKETTRLAPIAVGTLRSTAKDLVVGGYQIPKGTQMLASTMVLSHSEEHFPRAQEFIPERWLKDTKGELDYRNTHPFIFLPFGFGPRSCVGKRIANMEMEVALAKIVRNFQLSWPHEKDAEFESRLLYGLKTPLTLRVDEVPQ